MIKKAFSYLFKLKFLPWTSLFLFDHETWERTYDLKKFIKSVDPSGKKRIIDIGGGTGRLEQLIKRNDIYIYDINQQSIEIAKREFHNATLGSGSDIHFEDDYFDYAISIHTLEHITKSEREKFINEIIRVTKYGIFLLFPEGDYAEKLCNNYLNELKENNLPENRWTLEHLKMGLPLLSEIDSIFSKQDKFNYTYRQIRNYYVENFFWTKLRASRSKSAKLFLSPVLAIISFIFRNRLPTVELIVKAHFYQ